MGSGSSRGGKVQSFDHPDRKSVIVHRLTSTDGGKYAAATPNKKSSDSKIGQVEYPGSVIKTTYIALWVCAIVNIGLIAGLMLLVHKRWSAIHDHSSTTSEAFKQVNRLATVGSYIGDAVTLILSYQTVPAPLTVADMRSVGQKLTAALATFTSAQQSSSSLIGINDAQTSFQRMVSGNLLASRLSQASAQSFNSADWTALAAAHWKEVAAYLSALDTYAEGYESSGSLPLLLIAAAVAMAVIVQTLVTFFMVRTLSDRVYRAVMTAQAWFRSLSKLKAALESLHEGTLKQYEALMEQLPTFDNMFKEKAMRFSVAVTSHVYEPDARVAWEEARDMAQSRCRQLEQLETNLQQAALFEEMENIRNLLKYYRDNDFALFIAAPLDETEKKAEWAALIAHIQEHRVPEIRRVIDSLIDQHGGHLGDFLARILVFKVPHPESLVRLLRPNSGPALSIDEEFADAFHKFIHAEFCGENLAFWFAVEEYRDANTPADRAQLAGIIEQRFIASDSAECINISASMKNSIEKKLKGPTESYQKDLFDPAQAVVQQLMANNSYERFLQSDYCVKLNATLESKEAEIEQVLQPLKKILAEVAQSVSEFCIKLVRAGLFCQAQQMWKESQQLLNTGIDLTASECQEFLAWASKCHADALTSISLRQIRKGKRILEQVRCRAETAKRQWTDALISEAQGHHSVITALMRVQFLRELENVESRSVIVLRDMVDTFGRELALTGSLNKDDDKDDGEDAAAPFRIPSFNPARLSGNTPSVVDSKVSGVGPLPMPMVLASAQRKELSSAASTVTERSSISSAAVDRFTTTTTTTASTSPPSGQSSTTMAVTATMMLPGMVPDSQPQSSQIPQIPQPPLPGSVAIDIPSSPTSGDLAIQRGAALPSLAPIRRRRSISGSLRSPDMPAPPGAAAGAEDNAAAAALLSSPHMLSLSEDGHAPQLALSMSTLPVHDSDSDNSNNNNNNQGSSCHPAVVVAAAAAAAAAGAGAQSATV